MSLSDRSDAGRDPLALDGLLTDDERRPLSVQGHHQFREGLSALKADRPPSRRKSGEKSDRSEALRIITRLVGDAGVKSFLQCPQPDLGDRTGGELLQNSPGELLRRLQCLEAEAQSVHDEAAADPIHDHTPRMAPKHKVSSVISILDRLDKENTNRRFND